MADCARPEPPLQQPLPRAEPTLRRGKTTRRHSFGSPQYQSGWCQSGWQACDCGRGTASARRGRPVWGRHANPRLTWHTGCLLWG